MRNLIRLSILFLVFSSGKLCSQNFNQESIIGDWVITKLHMDGELMFEENKPQVIFDFMRSQLKKRNPDYSPQDSLEMHEMMRIGQDKLKDTYFRFKKDGVFESNFGQGLSQLGQEDVDLEMTYFIHPEDSTILTTVEKGINTDLEIDYKNELIYLNLDDGFGPPMTIRFRKQNSNPGAQFTIPAKVLFVGNSYTYFWNLPQQVGQMAVEKGVELQTAQSTAGGSNLGQHWRGEKELSTLELIRSNNYDAVVLQDHSLRAIDYPDSLNYYGILLADAIKASGAQPYLYMTWPRKWAPEKQSIIAKEYSLLAKRINARLVPVGLAWEKAIQEDPKIDLYDPDGSHPSTVGSYLSACVFFGVMTNQSPVGLPARLITKDKDGEKLYLNILPDETASFCQKIAEQVIQSTKD